MAEAPETAASQQENDESAPKEADKPRWPRRIARTLRWRAHWLLPNTIPGTHAKVDRVYYKQRDVEANAESRVPEEEELRLAVMWGTELYGSRRSGGSI